MYVPRTQCAVGCLIPDDKYNEGYEYYPISALPLESFGLSEHVKLLSKLQKIHDWCEVVDWESRLNDLERTL